MAETMWRYLDPAGNEHGPYTTGELRAYLQEGRIDRAGQVWREGMTAWASLDSVASELGLARPGGPRVVVRAPVGGKKGMSGCAIAAIVVLGGGLVFGGIFAAIAVSQYQDYVARSQVYEGAALADGVKTPVGEYYFNNERWPADNAAAGLAEPAEIHGMYASAVEVRPTGAIVVGFSSNAPQKAQASLDGATLVFTPTTDGATIQWACTSDSIAQKHCPSTCACR